VCIDETLVAFQLQLGIFAMPRTPERMQVMAAGAVVVALLSACAHAASGSAMRALHGDELRIAITGRTLETRPGSGSNRIELGARTELFCADGTWRLLGGRATVVGTFSVADNSFCVSSGDGDARCRHLHQAANGEHFTTLVNSNTPDAFTPVGLATAPEGCA
jgi:hypothetical protein